MPARPDLRAVLRRAVVLLVAVYALGWILLTLLTKELVK